MKTEPTITVIVPAYNAAHYLERSLPPLVAMRERGEIEQVIVVDDCSTESSNIETATRLGATVMKTPRNGGPGAARNYASQTVRSDILWFVDADVVAHDTGAALVRAAFIRHPEATALFGSYDDKPPARNFASQYKNLVHRYYHQRGKGDATTFWAGCGAVRRREFLAAGGFDGRRYGRPMIEDIELGFRLLDAGGRIRLVHGLLGTHLKKWSLVEVIRTDIFQRALPWSRLILGSTRQVNDLNVSPSEKVRAVIAGLWALSLLAAPAALFGAPVLWLLLGTTLLMLAANAPLAGFFFHARGLAFAIPAVLYHQVYYLYSSTVFAWCIAEKSLGLKGAAQAGAALSPLESSNACTTFET